MCIRQEREEEEKDAVQSKPQRVRPELKPKPRILPPINRREEEEEERDEDKIVAELQVSSCVFRHTRSHPVR